MTITVDRALFEAARERYQEESRAWETAALALAERQARAREVRRELDLIEARLAVIPDVVAGKNAEERAARLAVALGDDAAWARMTAEAEEGAREIAKAQVGAQAARDRLALAKRELDYEIAWVEYLGRAGGER